MAADRERGIAAAIAACGENAFEAASDDGRTPSLNQAVTEALGHPPPVPLDG